MAADAGSVQLLGSPRLRIGERTVAFRPDQRYRLLAHLAARAAREPGTETPAGGWVDRGRLAFLFWPDSDDATARRRLSQLLKRLRRFAWLDGLERDRYRVRWTVASDVAAFRAALRRGDAPRALELYRGAFLEGLDVGASAEYVGWLEHERAALGGAWRDALLRDAERRIGEGDPEAAAAALAPLTAADPLDEEALRLQLRALAGGGRSGEALRRYRRFARVLAADLGLEPSVESRELAAAIEAGRKAEPGAGPIAEGGAEPDVAVPSPRPAAFAGLPAPVTPFVGRDLERATLAHHLARLDYRLLVLVGPGGVGKSRLALQAARERPAAAPERVAFVALEAVEHDAEMLRDIARAVAVDPGVDPAAIRDRIAAGLGDARVLLVLDNVEQIAGAGAALADLLRRCPGLVCLVTSRVRLGVRAERLLPLEGLEFPAGPLPLADALRFDAVALFVERARRLWPDYQPTETDVPHLIALCRVTRGLPLALELAAAWLRATELADLAAAVADDFELLATDEADTPDRHRSIRAVFGHSWRLLSDAERSALRRTAIFRDGFRRDAADTVAGAPLPLLAALVDKSLLRLAPGGRYDRHPLLYRYAAEKLAADADARAELEVRHARYYLDLLQHHAGAFEAPSDEQRTALEAITAERENLRAAWGVALTRGWAARVVAAVEPLERFFQRDGSVELLRELFAAGVAAFEADPDARGALGLLLAKQGWYAQRAGEFESAVELSERSLALLRSAGPSVGVGQALNTLGFVAQQRERYPEAARYMREALAVARRVGDPWYVAGFGNNLALIEARLGRLDAADRLFGETLRLNRERGDLAEVAINLLNRADLALRRGDPERAARMAAEGSALAREIGFGDIEPYFLTLRGNVESERGDAERARELCLQAIERFGLPLERPEVIDRYIELGRIELRRDDPGAAGSAFGRALALAHRAGYEPGRHRALAGIAEVRLARGRASDAASLLTLLADRDDLSDGLRDRVVATLDRARADLAGASLGSRFTSVERATTEILRGGDPPGPGEAPG